MKPILLPLAALLPTLLLPAQAQPGAGAPRASLEMRLLADQSYDDGGVKFDLAEERGRLESWLARDGKALVDSHIDNIRLFNVRSAEAGGPQSRHLRWLPRIIRPSVRTPKRWDYAYSQWNKQAVVPLFTGDEYAKGPSTERKQLVEFFAINMHASHFTGRDLEPESLELTTDDVGNAALAYSIKEARRNAYGDWSEKNKGRAVALIVDGAVLSAPVFQSRIVGKGVITGNFTKQEAGLLRDALRNVAATSETEILGAGEGPVPAGADPADLRAMQSAQAMLAAEKKLKALIRAGKIKGIDKILTFEEISSWPYEDGLKGMPKQLNRIKDKTVMMTGFMLPIDEVDNIKEFLLVQSLWSCCYGQPPDINGIVRIVMKGKKRIDYQFEPIKIVGQFKIEATYEDGYCVDIFQVEADEVEVIR